MVDPNYVAKEDELLGKLNLPGPRLIKNLEV